MWAAPRCETTENSSSLLNSRIHIHKRRISYEPKPLINIFDH